MCKIKSVSLLLATIIIFTLCAAPCVAYADEPSSTDSFIEFDYETMESSLFTLADISTEQATLSINGVQGEAFTPGYDLPGTENTQDNASPAAILPNRPYERVSNVNVVP